MLPSNINGVDEVSSEKVIERLHDIQKQMDYQEQATIRLVRRANYVVVAITIAGVVTSAVFLSWGINSYHEAEKKLRESESRLKSFVIENVESIEKRVNAHVNSITALDLQLRTIDKENLPSVRTELENIRTEIGLFQKEAGELDKYVKTLQAEADKVTDLATELERLNTLLNKALMNLKSVQGQGADKPQEGDPLLQGNQESDKPQTKAPGSSGTRSTNPGL